MTAEEEAFIVGMHAQFGNKWAKMAAEVGSNHPASLDFHRFASFSISVMLVSETGMCEDGSRMSSVYAKLEHQSLYIFR